ncbi:hypothetical protein PVAP13_2KG000400 [Panicum virgatum]|uniref:Uncharacterized protein n=1 Tax=Panicum virgatum TaxID=38727 RepID=A0A8T0VWA9_PANVG|nr:hypothetical protein PVAP13_2KG000400 [Panicum virgatum]
MRKRNGTESSTSRSSRSAAAAPTPPEKGSRADGLRSTSRLSSTSTTSSVPPPPPRRASTSPPSPESQARASASLLLPLTTADPHPRTRPSSPSRLRLLLMAMIHSSMGMVVRRALSVEHLVKKTEEVAKKEVLFEYVDSLVKEQKEYPKPVLKGAGIPWFQAVVIIASFMAGYHVGLDEGTEATFLRLGRKRLD